MTFLSPHGLEQRIAQLGTRLDQIGATTIDVSGARNRKLVANSVAPGVPGLPELARFSYEEWFRGLRDGGFMRVRYHYNYFDLSAGGWRGYHLHELAPGGDYQPHAKCVGADGSGEEAAHYFAYEIDLWAAHDEFEAQYMAERAIECRGLPRLD
jgi:hypothetical protein